MGRKRFSPEHIITMLREAEVLLSRDNRELAFMKTMFNLAVEWSRLKENPRQSVKLLRGEEKRLRVLNADEISALVSEAAGYLKVVIIAAIETGMRKSELLDNIGGHNTVSPIFYSLSPHLVNSCLPLNLRGPLPFCADKNEGEDPETAEATG